MTRSFKVGDTVDVAYDEVAKLVSAYIPNFPDKITSTTGTVTSTYRLRRDNNKGFVTVALAMCPEIRNLQFDADTLELMIPTELTSLLNEINSRIDQLSKVDTEKEQG